MLLLESSGFFGVGGEGLKICENSLGTIILPNFGSWYEVY